MDDLERDTTWTVPSFLSVRALDQTLPVLSKTKICRGDLLGAKLGRSKCLKVKSKEIDASTVKNCLMRKEKNIVFLSWPVDWENFETSRSAEEQMQDSSDISDFLSRLFQSLFKSFCKWKLYTWSWMKSHNAMDDHGSNFMMPWMIMGDKSWCHGRSWVKSHDAMDHHWWNVTMPWRIMNEKSCHGWSWVISHDAMDDHGWKVMMPWIKFHDALDDHGW